MALDITADTARIAITASGKPGDTDWVDADWVTEAPAGTNTGIDGLSTEYRYVKIVATTGPSDSDTAWLRFLMGPLGVIAAPAAGVNTVWVKITDDPEVPVINAGSIKVT